MGEKLFVLQIVRPGSTRAIQLPGGGQLELDLVAACTAAIVKRGVGYGRSEAHVKRAISDGITEAITSLKLQTIKCL